MTKALLWMLVGLTTALGAGAALGKECKGVSFPDQSGALKLNGLGLRQATFLKVDVYVAALYVAQPSGDANAILKANAPASSSCTSSATSAAPISPRAGTRASRTTPRASCRRSRSASRRSRG